MNPIYTNTILDVEVLTPTHIGMAQEKNYVRGLDFMIRQNPKGDDKTLYILHPDRIIAQIARNPDDLTKLNTQLSQGKYEGIESLLNQLNVLTIATNIVRSELVYDDKISEIRRQLSSGLGDYLIAGSSLKGAIRSVIYKELKRRVPSANDTQMFGQITDNLMNLLIVSDTTVPNDSIKVYSTKVYSADGRPENGEGQWKQHNKKHSPEPKHIKEFSTQGFISYYEAIKPKTTTQVRIGIKSNAGHRKLTKIPNNDLFVGKSAIDLIGLIKAHTKAYLEREIKYYNAYKNDDLKQIAIDKLNVLLAQNNETNSCVIRVGANVGFHAITGDWQFTTHTEGWHFNAQSQVYQIKAKTRKFTFIKTRDGFDFQPMGFLKLTLLTQEEIEKRNAEQQKTLVAAQAEMQRKAEEMINAAEAARIAAEEAKKPKVFEGKLKRSSTIDAEVMNVSGNVAKIKLYVSNHEDRLFELRYAGLQIGQTLEVEVKDISGKGVVLAVGFKKIK